MNLRCTFALPLAAFALAPAQAAAAEGSAEVAFGQGTLLLPVPDGFADPSAAPPSAFDAIQRGLPEGARLMAVIIDDGFLARIAAGEHAHLSRYFIVHTGRGLAPGRRKGPAGAACLGASAGQVERGGRQGRRRHGAGASLRRIFDPIAGLPH